MTASAPAAYVAPELAAGAAPGPRADVFALGLTLLQLLAASEAAGLAAHAAATLGAAGPAGVERLVDPCAGAWPPAQAADFARLALRRDTFRSGFNTSSYKLLLGNLSLSLYGSCMVIGWLTEWRLFCVLSLIFCAVK